MDPPWPNRSVRRSGHYQTHHYSEMEMLTTGLKDILRAHLLLDSNQGDSDQGDACASAAPAPMHSGKSIAAIWITNAEKSRRAAYEALVGAGLRIREEWVWVKTTWDGEPISALDGLWRKPYEILVIGSKGGDYSDLDMGMGMEMGEEDLTRLSEAVTTRRVIAAVPDLHSRKPNLKALFEEAFLTSDGQLCSYSALEVFARNLTAGWWGVGDEVLRFNKRECWIESDQ
ncbi:MT-A70 family [Penicillium sp. DV-2018c]|nr:MT-A70 family [Penicillium sp. DV-2018c]